MIRRLLARLFRHPLRRPPGVRQEVTMLLGVHGTRGAWLEARNRWRMARKEARWNDSLVRSHGRYWNSVMREIERQTGYRHQLDAESEDLTPKGRRPGKGTAAFVSYSEGEGSSFASACV
ncbi:hypothetical protein [Aurantimonas endophytica]|uniref:Uncharacterized protein n=1 Tax=Aurantimonas endophytica TaxID=1522175 RepID=A0A7W6HE04_9HYPH|nr:hypothetical protein [Aurantimonas endophytica]MBB4003223.1 hypothetical protein [Aurantimonas endophytica]MCO6404087.1 hypothetical protein [Aurantimonas endophytica]